MNRLDTASILVICFQKERYDLHNAKTRAIGKTSHIYYVVRIIHRVRYRNVYNIHMHIWKILCYKYENSVTGYAHHKNGIMCSLSYSFIEPYLEWVGSVLTAFIILSYAYTYILNQNFLSWMNGNNPHWCWLLQWTIISYDFKYLKYVYLYVQDINENLCNGDILLVAACYDTIFIRSIFYNISLKWITLSERCLPV